MSAAAISFFAKSLRAPCPALSAGPAPSRTTSSKYAGSRAILTPADPPDAALTLDAASFRDTVFEPSAETSESLPSITDAMSMASSVVIKSMPSELTPARVTVGGVLSYMDARTSDVGRILLSARSANAPASTFSFMCVALRSNACCARLNPRLIRMRSPSDAAASAAPSSGMRAVALLPSGSESESLPKSTKDASISSSKSSTICDERDWYTPDVITGFLMSLYGVIASEVRATCSPDRSENAPSSTVSVTLPIAATPAACCRDIVMETCEACVSDPATDAPASDTCPVLPGSDSDISEGSVRDLSISSSKYTCSARADGWTFMWAEMTPGLLSSPVRASGMSVWLMPFEEMSRIAPLPRRSESGPSRSATADACSGVSLMWT